jgi:pimeloyl-ACP methyl ester carboxylesterase
VALIHHVVAGTGSPPIVFVHGFGCSHTDWQAQVGHLSARHLTVAVDLPGHGATPATGEPGSIARCGMAVAELLRARSLPPAVLVGHSMGCRVVLDAALRAPEHVTGVALVDGSRFAATAVQAFEARFAADEYSALVRGMFEQMFTPSSDPNVVAAAARRALALPEDVGRALLLSLVRYDMETLDSALERVGRPLLVLQTTFINDRRERTPMTAGQTTPYLQYMRAKVPGARVEVLPGIGHFPQLDAPADTNRVLASFLAECRAQ